MAKPAPLDQDVLWRAHPSSGLTAMFKVDGCKHPTVGGIVQGMFEKASSNHGRPVFKRTAQVKGFDVLCYFWDDRDGPAYGGWWFGPKVGGDQVWAYNKDKASPVPPPGGWQVPYGGPVDRDLKVIHGNPDDFKDDDEKKEEKPKTNPAAEGRRWGRLQTGGDGRGAREAAAAATAPPATSAATSAANGRSDRDRDRDRARDRDRDRDRDRRGSDRPLTSSELAAKRKDQMAAARERIEAEKAKVAEALAARQAEQQARADAQKKILDEKRKKAEEERLAKLEEFKKRQEEVQAKAKEQQALNKVRRILQKVRFATLDTLEALENELQEAQVAEADNLGDSLEVIMNECEQALDLAKKRVDGQRALRAQELAKKEELEKAKAEREAKALELTEQLEVLVLEAEVAVETARDAVAPLQEFEGDEDPTKLLKEVVKASEQTARDADVKLKACSNFVSEHGATMRGPPVGPGQTKSDAAVALEALMKRVTAAKRAGEEVAKGVPAAKEKARRRAFAKQRQQEIEAVFTKYDKNGDGHLSKAETLRYAKGEFGVILSEKEIDRFFKFHADEDDVGVAPRDISLLNCAIGVKRECARDVRRRKERLEREERIKAATEKVLAHIRGVAKVVQDADQELTKLEATIQPLATQAKRMTPDAIKKSADAHEALVAPVQDMVKSAREAFTDMTAGMATGSTEFREILSKDPTGKRSACFLGRMEVRLARVATLLRRHRETGMAKQTQEQVKHRNTILRVIWHNQRLKNLTIDELFEAFDADKDGQIGEKDFCGFLASADLDVIEADTAPRPPGGAKQAEDAPKAEAAGEDGAEPAAETGEAADSAQPAAEERKAQRSEIQPGAAKKLFAELLQEYESAAAFLDKEAFLNFVRIRYVALKSLAVTSKLSIEGSTTVCKLEFGQVLELLQGPVHEDAVGVARIYAKVATTGQLGWATVRGNKDGKYLQPGGSWFKVVKATFFTEALENFVNVSDDAPEPTPLKVGERLLTLEGPKLDEQSGLLRLKARSSSGHVGWVTTTDSQGVAYVQPILWK